MACQVSSETTTIRAGATGDGGHRPSTGETQAEDNGTAEKAITIAMPRLVNRTSVTISKRSVYIARLTVTFQERSDREFMTLSWRTCDINTDIGCEATARTFHANGLGRVARRTASRCKPNYHDQPQKQITIHLRLHNLCSVSRTKIVSLCWWPNLTFEPTTGYRAGHSASPSLTTPIARPPSQSLAPLHE